MNTFWNRFHKIWKIALPMVIQGIVFQLQSLTDKAFLGNVDSTYISALGASQFPFLASLETIVALATGVIILTSRLCGAGDHKKINRYMLSTATFGSIITSILFLVWFIFTKDVLSIFRVDSKILTLCIPYIRICSISILFLGVDSAISAMLQGEGDTKPIMLCGLAKVLLNVILSYILIFGKISMPALGMEGAAIGTLLSNLCSAAGLFVYCFIIKCKKYNWSKKDLKQIKFDYYKEVLEISIPTALEYFLWNASNLVLMAYLNGISYHATAIYTLTFGIEVIVYMVFDGTGKASMTLIGQDIGAKNYKSADSYLKTCTAVNSVLITICVSCFAIFSGPILHIFTKDIRLISMSQPFLVFTAVIMYPKSINVLIGNGIRAHKDTKWMLYTQIFGSIFTVSFSYVLLNVIGLGITAIYITLFFDEALRAIINLIHYIKKHSQKHQLECSTTLDYSGDAI